MSKHMKPGSPFLHDDTTDRIVGIKNTDGTETSFLPPATEDIAGTKNGSNANFTISNGLATYCSVHLNGVRLKAGVGYTRAGAAITAAAGYIPASTDTYEADLA